MSTCTHDRTERILAADADAMCPLCLADDINAIGKLVLEAWNIKDTHLTYVDPIQGTRVICEEVEELRKKVAELDEHLLYRERTSKNNGLAAAIGLGRVEELEGENEQLRGDNAQYLLRIKELTEYSNKFYAEGNELRERGEQLAREMKEMDESLRSEIETFRATLADNEAYGLTIIHERDELRARLERAEAASQRDEATCEWTPDNDPDWNTWSSQCGKTWVFEEDGPAENDMRFCPFCGRLLVAGLPAHEGGEE